MDNVADPTWVQTGELGIAFVVIILFAWVVWYVFRTSGEREKRYIDIINGIVPAVQSIADQFREFSDRLKDIEEALNIKHRLSDRHKGLHLDS